MRFENKVVIVTGAASGIGFATAMRFAEEGARLVLVDRNSEQLHKAKKKITQKFSSSVSLFCFDISREGEVKECINNVVRDLGSIDVLFNNAGGGAPKKLIEDLTYEDWQNVVDANLTGTFLCSQEAIKIMKNQSPMGGRIINNGSISAYAPRPDSAPYTATKHGVSGLTKSISLDGRKYNIACSQIDIGNAATDMTERMKKGVPQANGSTMVEPTFDVNHVAEVVVNISNFPLETNVQFITIMATKMPFIGRG